MAFLIQLSDTHILPPGELLYKSIDTASHLRESVHQIKLMRPQPDAVIVTGDLVDRGDLPAYQHFIDIIKPLKMPVYIVPGNHDNPELMREVFYGTDSFPVTDKTFQFAIEHLPFRILALNSHCKDTELPCFDDQRLAWLETQLERSDKPTLIALHHPPMTTGIELIDMGGSEWYQGIKSVLGKHEHVRLVICGHCHTDLSGRIGQVPVYMAPATSHQLLASRGLNIAPSGHLVPAPPTLHHFIDGDFLSGSNRWPADVEQERIDKVSGISWEQLKKNMMGNRQ